MPACFHLDIVQNSCGMVEAVKFMLSALSRLADKVCCIAVQQCLAGGQLLLARGSKRHGMNHQVFMQDACLAASY